MLAENLNPNIALKKTKKFAPFHNRSEQVLQANLKLHQMLAAIPKFWIHFLEKLSTMTDCPFPTPLNVTLDDLERSLILF